jgi:PAS domain S-box-containing protein
VSLIILALYFWAYFANVKSISAALLVSDNAAILAGISIAVASISYLWAPHKYISWSSLAAYILLCITSATLILNTGGTTSPFIALWMIVSVFAGVFGAYGLIPLFVALIIYFVMQATAGILSKEAIIAIVLGGELPLAVSYLIWHTKSTTDDTGDKAYRQLASELSQVAGKSEVVINAIADGVVALDAQGIIQLINPAAQQIIGWGKQDALSLNYKSVFKLVDKKDQELTNAADPISQALTTNQEVTTKDLGLMTNSGKKLLVSIVVSPVAQLGSGVIVVFRDITKESAEEREQAEFISTASHEMRTPVAAIEGYLGLALNPATAQIDEKARDYITKAHESAEHLGRLFQDLLDVTRADDGRLSNNPKVVDVVAFAHDIVQGLRPKALEKGLSIIYKPQPDDTDDRSNERRLNPVFYVNLDNDHLREVIGNLVENAIKYTLKGTVVIDITGDNDHVTISITDSGIGIPKEDMAHLFQKFYRVDNTDTREIGGTGLGLYLCRRLTEAMNGRIWVESQYKQGSTFFVEFPRTAHEDAMRLIEESASAPKMIELPPAPPIIQLPQLAPPVAAPRLNIQSSIQPAPVVQSVTYRPEVANTPASATSSVAQPPQAPTINQNPTATVQSTPQQPQHVPQQPTPLNLPRHYATLQNLDNTPLSSIEQNPGQYIQNRNTQVTVPPRSQE